ncbi:MAG: hypothetical protein ACMV0Y_02280 [Paludibacter sp.]
MAVGHKPSAYGYHSGCIMPIGVLLAEGHIHTNPTAVPWDGQRPHAEWHLRPEGAT